MTIPLIELKRIVDEALKRYQPDCEVEFDQELNEGMPIMLKPGDEWPYNLGLSN